MKINNRTKNRFFSITICIILLFVLNTNIFAIQAREFSIEEYKINATIDESGNMHVVENITYLFAGDFNGVLMDISIKPADSIILENIYITYDDGVKKNVMVSESDYSNTNGEQGTYTYKTENDILSLKIFEPSYSVLKTFTYEFTLNNVISVYNDVAAFYWHMISDGWDSSIRNIEIMINLPEGAKKEDLRAWAHGPLEGFIEIVDGNTYSFSVISLPPNTYLETRLVFPKTLVSDAKKIVNENALDKIIAEENKWADDANKIREESRKKVARDKTLSDILEVISVILLPIWLILIIFFYMKYDKELKPKFTGKYYRDLPSNISPAEVSYLMKFKNVGTNDVTATLLDLVRKCYLKLDPVTITKKRLLGVKEISTYRFTLLDPPALFDLKEHESHLINWFINEIGNGECVTLEDIKNETSNKITAFKFKNNYNMFIKAAKKEGHLNGFLDEKASTSGKIIGSLVGFFYIVWGIFIGVFYLDDGAKLFLTVLGVIMLLYSIRIKKRSMHGVEEYSKWKALKKFLLHFSRMDKKDIPELILWEQYLVYAVSFGIAKKVIKQLPFVFSQDEFNRNSLTYLYLASYGSNGFYTFSNMMNSTIHAVNNSVSTAKSIAMSSNSSGSGFGGGFSGGGGGAF